MPNQPQASIENNFTGGLKTEFTGLNFPENACTAASNCVFSIIGDVNRREGFDFEVDYQLNNTPSTLGTAGSIAVSTYKWNNAGGDGTTQIVVQQTGDTLYFYLSTAATSTNPLSKQILVSTVSISQFLATNAVTAFDPTVECTFSDGNGYLFVFNPQCDPFYCSYNSGNQTLTPHVITVQVRDFAGVPDGLLLNTRPTTLSPEHSYNLVNQGWASSWNTSSNTSNTIGTGTFIFTVSAGLPVVIGSTVVATGTSSGAVGTITGTISSYTGITLTISETANTGAGTYFNWTITPSPNVTNAWFAVLGNYPANSDVWWYYRNTNVTSNNPDGTFTPNLAKSGYIIPTNAQAPQGSVLLNAFIQQRTLETGILGLTDVTTTTRPSNGCFFQGRVFYTGVNASFQATGDAPFFTWTESIYFSQVFINNPNVIGYCYQQNDPTSSTIFNLLPTDGGVINIPGSGQIYKLFPISNGLFVFAANGIWFIGGGESLGFSANDYTVSKISGIQSIGSFSYVNVLGWPVFWNEEGIYEVKPGKENVPYGHGGFTVENLALGTILSYYNTIPLQSKKFARGDYDPLSYTIQWLFRSTNETGIATRYQFDSALNINTYKGPFYPYSFTLSTSTPYVCSILYVTGPGGSNTPESQFEYLTCSNNQYTFSQERDNVNWQDWNSTGTLVNYTSTFTSGYKLHGQAWKLWWLGYIWMYSNNSENTAYGIRGLWNYGTSGNSGKWSTQQIINNNIPNFGNVARKIRIRGHGLALQLQINSVTGSPFNFAGWSMYENINVGI